MKIRFLILSLSLIALFAVGRQIASAADAPVIVSPNSSDSYTAASLTIQATAVTGDYRNLGLYYSDGAMPDNRSRSINVTCKSDPANSRQQLCTALVDMTRLTANHNYYFQIYGVNGNVRTVGNYITVRRVLPVAQPVIINPSDGKSYAPTQPQVYREVIIEEQSAQPYYGVLILADDQGKIYRRDNFGFNRNNSGKYRATLDLNMRQQAGGAMLPAGTYYLQALSYTNGNDRNKGLNAVASDKVHFSYNLQVAKIKFTAPGANVSLPACRLRVQVVKDETYGVTPLFKLYRYDLSSNVAAGGFKANKPNTMSLIDSNNAYLDWDLSGTKAGTRFQLSASAYYQPLAAKNPVRVDASRLNFTIANASLTAGVGCNTAIADQILYFRPTVDKLCLGTSGQPAVGPEAEKNVWRPGEQGWSWTCPNPCLDQGGNGNCSSLAPVAQLTANDGGNGRYNFILKTNVPDNKVYRVELWTVPAGGSIADSGARKLAAFGRNGSNYYLVNIFFASALRAGENNFLAVIYNNIVNPVNGLYIQVWSNSATAGSQTAVNGLCGSSHNGHFALKPTAGLCADSSLPTVYGSGPWTWTCVGSGGGRDAFCKADYSAVKVDAGCGTAVSQTYQVGEKPTSGLCSPEALAHSEPALNNAGLWAWTCYGQGGGASSQCTSKDTLPHDGVCGLSHGLYFEVQPTKDLCTDGSLPPVSGNGPWTWLCAGINGGQTASCSALKRASDGNNTKDPSKYFAKQVFIINDTNWQTALSYVPVAVWTGSSGQTVKFPLLVYKNESGRMDLDSTIHFLQQYQAGHASLIDHNATDAQRVGSFLSAISPIGAGIPTSAIDSQSSQEILSYWSSYNDVVYVENDYEKALVASTYASLINAPLIIRQTALDTDANFVGKNVICVGSVSRNCASKYLTLDSLRDQYLAKAQALTGRSVNKIILTNPKDWSYSIRSSRPENPIDGFKTQRTGDYLASFFGKMSLASAYLAAAKQELIVTAAGDIGANGSDAADPAYYGTNNKRSNPGSNCADGNNRFKCATWAAVLKTWVTKLNLPSSSHPNISGQRLLDGYLTIVADPQAIPWRTRDANSSLFFYPADKYLFASTEGNYQPELAYGRITGYTISDASAYVNLAVFYNKLAARNSFALFSSRANGLSAGNNFVTSACSALKNAGYSDKACLTSDSDQYSDKYNGGGAMQKMLDEASLWTDNDLDYFHDHGNEDFAGITSEYLPPLASTFVGTMACSTAEASINVNLSNSFALMAMRQGAIGYIGSVDETYEHDADKQFLSAAYYSGKSIPAGKIFGSVTRWLPDTYLGDPTIALVADQPGARGANQSLYK